MKEILYSKENFEEFCRDHYNEIFHYIRKQTRNTEDAKDLTQDIFLKAYNKLHTFNRKKATMRTWLYKIAYNHLINYFKSSYYTKNINVDSSFFDNYDSKEDILEYCIQHESIEEIMVLIKELLNSKHYKIMNYYFFSNMSNDEISKTLGIPVKTIRNVIPLSLKKIKQRLEDTLYERI